MSSFESRDKLETNKVARILCVLCLSSNRLGTFQVITNLQISILSEWVDVHAYCWWNTECEPPGQFIWHISIQLWFTVSYSPHWYLDKMQDHMWCLDMALKPLQCTHIVTNRAKDQQYKLRNPTHIITNSSLKSIVTNNIHYCGEIRAMILAQCGFRHPPLYSKPAHIQLYSLLLSTRIYGTVSWPHDLRPVSLYMCHSLFHLSSMWVLYLTI